MNASSKFDYPFKVFKEKYKNEISQIGKILGKGAFGEVRDVKYKNKSMAIKIIERNKGDKIEGEKLAINLRSHNIIKIQKIYEGEKIKNTSRDKNKEGSNSSDYYDFIIMEKAVLRDLAKLNEFYHRHNLLKLIKGIKDTDKYVFNENSGDSLLRFYARQIINALEILDDNNYVHFDIKPDNLLISINLIIRLTDFSLLREVKDSYIDFKIPGGTQGYITPEYYIDKRVGRDTARKQDFFALGSSLFLLKYGLQLLKYKKCDDDNRMNADRIVDLLQQNINFLKSQTFTDRDFIFFIKSLVGYTPEERVFFQHIIRNKWLNKNVDELDRIVMGFENDEEKLIIELQKNDYFLQKEEYLENRKNKKSSKSNKYCFKKKQNDDYWS